MVSNLKLTVEESKQKLASSLGRKVLSVYAQCVPTSWMTPTDFSPSTEQEFELKDALIKFILYSERDQPEVDNSGVKQSSIAKLTAPAIYRRAKANLASSRELLVHYGRASEQVAFSQGISMMESGWEKDNETLQHILGKQKVKAKLELQQFLSEDSKSSKEQVEEGVSKLDTDLWDHFGVGKTKMESVEALSRKRETWAAVAKNVHRGVRRALKDIPEDDKRCP